VALTAVLEDASAFFFPMAVRGLILPLEAWARWQWQVEGT
jgi:hypothetical protein